MFNGYEALVMDAAVSQISNLDGSRLILVILLEEFYLFACGSLCSPKRRHSVGISLH